MTALAAVGAGASFEDAYAALGAGALQTFVANFDAIKEQSAGIAVSDTLNTSGDHGWILYAFPPNSLVTVHINGPGYDLMFTVTADDRGMFRGSFGSTAADGAYTIGATSGTVHATADIPNTR
jgi:hypothetical protein